MANNTNSNREISNVATAGDSIANGARQVASQEAMTLMKNGAGTGSAGRSPEPNELVMTDPYGAAKGGKECAKGAGHEGSPNEMAGKLDPKTGDGSNKSGRAGENESDRPASGDKISGSLSAKDSGGGGSFAAKVGDRVGTAVGEHFGDSASAVGAAAGRLCDAGGGQSQANKIGVAMGNAFEVHASR